MKKKLVIGICVGVLVIALVVAGIAKNAGSAGTGPVFSVSAAEIKKDDISSFISANGTVAEVEKSEVYLDTPIKVTKLLIKQNDVVKKGQQLAEFDMESLNMELEQQKLQMKTQELMLKKLKLTDTTVSVASSQNSVKVAENSVASAQRTYDIALKDRDDTKALYDMGDKSKSELDRAENALKDAEAALKNAKLSLESQKEAFNSANKTNNQNASSKQIDIESQQVAIQTTQLAIKQLESRVKKYQEAMYAAMDGIASKVNVTEGSFTPGGQPVFTVVDPNKLEVMLNINEYNAKIIKPGQSVDITGDSIPEKEKITGKVKTVSPVANTNMNSSGSQETVIQVVVSIDSVNDAIKPGITVNCDIKTVDMKNILTLQLDMLSPDKDGNNFVYVISKDKQTMKKVAVELGTTSDMKAELKTGDIKEGDLVIMNPKTTYKDGARVKLSEG
ncbi:putative efflux system component YknX [Ruminiclostridium hungatei]|uniref:Putative efflux system component YknX n=1 Tax=Ruminiclostridium hungatei TaxID=48256 RepID=A0A1V4SR24_RUMHU|nr:HlyD family efflux transporter periplasmic adaptor subunit [Ruminiclostridium hungatei]OPX46233.1 putative efflux system component YknX [Ruminiclostridium hungatei]